MLNLTESHITQLAQGNAVRNRLIKSSKTKVIRLKVGNLPTRIKVTHSQAIAIKDSNDCFISGLCPDYQSRWRDRDKRNDADDLEDVISFMRIRMELRTDIISAAFSDPQNTLNILQMEHDASLN